MKRPLHEQDTAGLDARPSFATVSKLKIRPSRPDDGARAVTIWREAVDATHHFVTPADRIAIDKQVREFLPNTPLWLAVDHADQAVGFMELSKSYMGALFIAPAFRGIGVGRLLVAHALSLEPAITTDVNEQNGQAEGFYRRLGFLATGRSQTDDYGRPYPLIRLRLTRHRFELNRAISSGEKRESR